MAKRYKYSKMWQVLKEAKKYLLTELSEDWWMNLSEHKFICIAVGEVFRTKNCSFGVYNKVTDYITNKQLEGHSSLENWLVSKSIVSGSNISYDRNSNNSRKIQTTRHLWLDHMVKTLKEKNL